MNFDGNLIFSNNQAIGAASVNSSIIPLDSPGAYHTLYVLVSLTTAMTSGTVDTITLQVSDNSDMSSPTNLLALTVSGITQSIPTVLAQFKLPVKGMKKYCRLVYASTSPVGGKVFAGLVKDVPVR